MIDDQHHYSDILGGAFLGTLVAIVYALRAIPRYKRVLSPEAIEDANAVGAGVSRPGISASDDELAILGSGHSSMRRTQTGSQLREVVVSHSEVAA